MHNFWQEEIISTYTLAQFMNEAKEVIQFKSLLGHTFIQTSFLFAPSLNTVDLFFYFHAG